MHKINTECNKEQIYEQTDKKMHDIGTMDDIGPIGAFVTLDDQGIDRERSGFIHGPSGDPGHIDDITFGECDDLISTVLEMADWDPDRAMDLMVCSMAVFTGECIPSPGLRASALEYVADSLDRSSLVYDSVIQNSLCDDDLDDGYDWMDDRFCRGD